MTRTDIAILSEAEKEILADSFQRGESKRRLRRVLWSTALMLLGVVLFVSGGFGVTLIGTMAIAVLIVSAIEKISYQNTMSDYESLVRKLVHRVEQLEGVEYTPLDADKRRVLRADAPRGAAAAPAAH